MLKLKPRTNKPHANLEKLAEKDYSRITILEKFQQWHNSINYFPTTSKICLSLTLGSVISAPFYQKEGIIKTLGAFAAGAYVSYVFLSCPNNREYQ